MQRPLAAAIEVLRGKEILLVPLLVAVSLFGCAQTAQRKEDLRNGQVARKKAWEHKGWKIELLGVEKSQRQLVINDFPLEIGSAKAPKAETENLKPRGVFLLVTLSLEKRDGETLQLLKSLVVDEKGQQFPALAVGGKGTGTDFIFLKGTQGPENSATCQLAFDVPLESTNFKLRLLGDSPEIDLPKADK